MGSLRLADDTAGVDSNSETIQRSRLPQASRRTFRLSKLLCASQVAALYNLRDFAERRIDAVCLL